MTLAKAMANTNETFIVQASLTIVAYDRQNIFIVQATGLVYSLPLGRNSLREGGRNGGSKF